MDRSKWKYDAPKPASWFILGRHSVLDAMIAKLDFSDSQIDDISLFLNFSKENINYSIFPKNHKFVNIAIFNFKDQKSFDIFQYCWNRENKYYDGAFLINTNDKKWKKKFWNYIINIIQSKYKSRYNINMSVLFKKIIMNPPYGKLHLKILEEAINHLEDNNSKVVNLSPDRWLKDPLASYKDKSDFKKFEESISKHIESLDDYIAKDAEQLFGGEKSVVFKIDLGIYVVNKQQKNIYNYMQFKNSVLDKIVKSSACGMPVQNLGNVSSGNFCILNDILGNHDGVPGFDNYMPLVKTVETYGKYYFKGLSEKNNNTVFQNKNTNKRSTNGNPNNWTVVELNSVVELENFYNSTLTNFFKYVFCSSLVDVNVHHKFLPWMGDSINPRTGKKGYESEWTDEDFYQFFNITDEEKKVIEETMAKYVK